MCFSSHLLTTCSTKRARRRTVFGVQSGERAVSWWCNYCCVRRSLSQCKYDLAVRAHAGKCKIARTGRELVMAGLTKACALNHVLTKYSAKGARTGSTSIFGVRSAKTTRCRVVHIVMLGFCCGSRTTNARNAQIPTTVDLDGEDYFGKIFAVL